MGFCFTLGNVAPLNADGSFAEIGVTTTRFVFPHDDRDHARLEVLDAWPYHSAKPPAWCSEDEDLFNMLVSDWPDMTFREA